jgi:catechol 2,3-dioxygenase-like lactoylglutathione lyase family enzyme
MAPLTIRHVGIHVRDIDEEMGFLSLLGAELTSIGKLPRGRVAFVSLDGVYHHSLAVFEDGEPLPTGDSQKEKRGLDHIAMETDGRDAVDAWKEKLSAAGVTVHGPFIQGPKGGGIEHGSGSYTIFFHDPNGICFEIFTEPLTVSEYREQAAVRNTVDVPA